MNMLSDEDRASFDTALEALSELENVGLTDSIRRVSESSPKKSFTATEVRDVLKKAGFDFSSYKANPLASIHSVLKRLKPDEVEATDIDGVAAWRWIKPPLPPVSARPHLTDTTPFQVKKGVPISQELFNRLHRPQEREQKENARRIEILKAAMEKIKVARKEE